MKKIISTEVTTSNIAQIIEYLSNTPKNLESLGSRCSAEQLEKPLGMGERSLAGILAHILHCEAISSEFIYLALLRDEVDFPDIHPEREFGKLVRYDLFPFRSLLDYFTLRRTVLLRVLTSLKADQWSRTMVEAGKKRKESVYWRARAMALHELDHLRDIEIKLDLPKVE